MVGPVRGIRADDPEALRAELGEADVAATSVGNGAFETVIASIGRALAPPADSAASRPDSDIGSRSRPVDLILAENIHGAAARARAVLGESTASRIGLVETSIGKMVPIMPAEIREQDPLLCWAEPYNTLIVDRSGFLGPVPKVPSLKAVSPIGPWVDRKLYIHNMGHAAAAYLGYANIPEAEYIWEVLSVASIRLAVRAAMDCSANALAHAYPASFTRAELEEHVEDLLARFQNRALGDTVYRVGRDVPRKLRRHDRIVGAIALCRTQGVDPAPILPVFRAALSFDKRAADGTRLTGDAEFREAITGHGTTLASHRDEYAAWILNDVVGIGETETELRALLSEALR